MGTDRKPGLIKRLWKWWRTPQPSGAGDAAVDRFCRGDCLLKQPTPGWKSQYRSMFCISCHEMRNTVYQEYMQIPGTTTTVAASVRPVRIVTFRTSLCQR